MCLGFTLGLLFYLWAKLPKPVKNGVRKIGKIVGRKRSDNGAKR
jgi:hypothetical protein